MTDVLRPELDHAIVLVHGELDRAAQAYAALGFHLTPRGHHSLGSSNNLAIFADTYLELLGYEGDAAPPPSESWRDPPGLSGIVWRCPDPAAAHRAIAEAGIDSEPLDFSRPVRTDAGAFEAAFTILPLPRLGFDHGRTFFCHHKTPELVYRHEWRAHRNGARDIAEFVFSGADPRAILALFERLFGPGLAHDVPGGVGFQAGAARVLALTPEAAAARYGADAPPIAPGQALMIGLTFATASLAEAEAALKAGGVPFAAAADGRLRVAPAHTFGVAIEFCA